MTDNTPKWSKGMDMKGMRATLSNMNEALDKMRQVYEAHRKQLNTLKRDINGPRMGK